MNYQSVEDFIAADRNIPFPSRPLIARERYGDRKLNESLEAFLLRKEEAKREYQQELQEYFQQVDVAKKQSAQLAAEFREFCIQKYIHPDIPDNLKQQIYDEAYEDAHAYGYSEIASRLESLAEVFNAVFEAGTRISRGID
jgi:flagellar biosynthesis/type III secretory pathway protein FliH